VSQEKKKEHWVRLVGGYIYFFKKKNQNDDG
jgi:hypothetical protein